MIRDLTAKTDAREELSPAEVGQAVEYLIGTETPDADKAAFLVSLRTKGETAREIAAFAQVLLKHAVDPGLAPGEFEAPVIDVCGTGGDRMDLFNVSTTSMFLVAAAGAVVVKHGNRSVTSKCGTADVLEELGIQIDAPPAGIRRALHEVGIGFFFAPLFHPAFKQIGPVRKQLAERGLSSVFNLLGPLLNPARPAHQLVGIFSRDFLPQYAEVLRLLGRKRAWAVHGGGCDELSLSATSDIYDITPEEIRQTQFNPEDAGLPRAALSELKGGDRAANAAILLGILDGSITGPKRDVVLLNAAAALQVTGVAEDWSDAIALAREQIDSGRALAKLRALQQFRG